MPASGATLRCIFSDDEACQRVGWGEQREPNRPSLRCWGSLGSPQPTKLRLRPGFMHKLQPLNTLGFRTSWQRLTSKKCQRLTLEAAFKTPLNCLRETFLLFLATKRVGWGEQREPQQAITAMLGFATLTPTYKNIPAGVMNRPAGALQFRASRDSGHKAA